MKYKKGDEEAKTVKRVAEMMDSPKIKPMLHIDSEDLPAMKKWEVGKTYALSLKVKEVGKRLRDDEECCEFEIESVKEA